MKVETTRKTVIKIDREEVEEIIRQRISKETGIDTKEEKVLWLGGNAPHYDFEFVEINKEKPMT